MGITKRHGEHPPRRGEAKRARARRDAHQRNMPRGGQQRTQATNVRTSKGRVHDAAAERRADSEGHCVVHALMSSIRMMQCGNHLRTHAALLKHLRTSVRRGTLSKRSVSWNGEKLSEQFLGESERAVESTQLCDGYLASSCDPLLIAFAAAFNVSVRHDFCGHTSEYEVHEPEWIVCLASDTGHMSLAGVLSSGSRNSQATDIRAALRL